MPNAPTMQNWTSREKVTKPLIEHALQLAKVVKAGLAKERRSSGSTSTATS